MFYHLPEWLFGSNTALFHLDRSFYICLTYKAVSLQTSLQDLEVVLQHGAAGRARSRPGALHHPVGAGGALRLHRRLPAGWRGAGAAGAQQGLLWLIGWNSAVAMVINVSVLLKWEKEGQKPGTWRDRDGEVENVTTATLKCWHRLLGIELSPEYMITLE